MCALHGTEFVRLESSHQVYAEPKDRKKARALSSGLELFDKIVERVFKFCEEQQPLFRPSPVAVFGS